MEYDIGNCFKVDHLCWYTAYYAAITPSSSSGISKGALAGIILGAIACAVTLSAIVSILILRVRMRDYHALSKRRNGEYLIMS